MTYKRQCENWVQTFCQWTLPRSESPETFIFWSGVFALAGAMRRRVRVPRRLLGSWDAFPNLYVIFVAPPGKARKSTTLNYVEDLYEGLAPGTLTPAPTFVTQAALLDRLIKSTDSSVYVLSAEFASLIAKSGVSMFEFLTDMFDGRRHVEGATISRGVEFAEKPCVNLLAATTPKWIAENMPESVIGGGFASRVIFIYEDKVRRRKFFYDDLDPKEYESLRDKLVADLQHIASLEGEFNFADAAARNFIVDWYNSTADNIPTTNYRLFGYYERKPAHVLRLAMLLRLAYSDELILSVEDLESAIYQLEITEGKLAKAFQAVGKNVYSSEQDEIFAYITEHGKVERFKLLQEFYSAAEPNKLEELINGLLSMGVIRVEIEGTKGYYVPVI
jgi:hypothetical protein